MNYWIREKKLEIRIYEEFSEELINKWNVLYRNSEVDSVYNLNPCWCIIWWNNFKERKSKLKILIIEDRGELKLLAPLYEKNNMLFLIGTEIDFIDEFRILYKDKKYYKFFLDYLFKNNYQINWRFLNVNTEEFKELFKYIYLNEINYSSEIIDIKPYVKTDFLYKKKIRDDINRIENKIFDNFKEKVTFNYDEEKTEKLFNIFLDFHYKKWGENMFENEKIVSFFKDQVLKNESTKLSTLRVGDNIIAVHLGYEAKNILSSAVPTYNSSYKEFSPGKVLLYKLVTSMKENNNKVNTVDFGRGAEQYKSWFSNAEDTLVNFTVIKHNNRLIIFKFIIKILKKIFRLKGVK